MNFKFFIITILSLVSSVAFTCPDLEGKYTCHGIGEEESSTLEVEQNGNEFKIKHPGSIGMQTIVANGEPLVVNLKELSGRHKAYCEQEENSLTIDSKMKLISSNAQSDTFFEYKKISDEELKFIVTSKFFKNGLKSKSRIEYKCIK